MRHILREPVLALGAALALAPPALIHFFGGNAVAFGGPAHFFFVGVTAGAATAAAFALTVAGTRSRDGRTVIIATAFSVMAALLVVHGLATPGLIVEFNGVVGFSGAATLPVGGALLVLCTIPALRRPAAVRPLLWLQGILLVGVVGLGAAAIVVPSLVPSVPEVRSVPAYILLAVGLVLYGLVAWRAARTYRLTRRGADLMVIVGIVWLAAALAAALLLDYLQLGWWIGHGLEVMGIAAIGVPVAIDLRRGAKSRPLHGDLRASELVRSEEAFLGAQVRSLIVQLAVKDASTEEHTRRVALRAVQVGEELGLSPERLRVLAAGGLLHDIGKLSVPTSILAQPRPLSRDEYAIVKKHPEAGEKLLAELGFGHDVRRLVLDHHERIDGSGYPRGRSDGALDLETRILTVCDVYDALLSPRVYRSAWPHERAIALLREQSGKSFDPKCVGALERVLEREHAPTTLKLAV